MIFFAFKFSNTYLQINKYFTYLQYDSPFVFGIHLPLFLHGDGEHDINPVKKISKTINSTIDVQIILS